MIRGSLFALIFEKTMSLDVSTARNNEAVTLMSADIEGIEPGVELIHEIWASIVELGVALYLLERKVGAACFFVVMPAVIASFLTSRLMRAMGPARMIWSKGIQKRVSATSNMLGHMKGLKMMGAHKLHGHCNSEPSLQRPRGVQEIPPSSDSDPHNKYKSSLSSQLTPVVVIAGAIFWTRRGQDQELSTADIFSILVIVSLVSDPVSQLISCLPNSMASIACFDRIQEYLLLAEQRDTRKNFEQLRIEFPRPCTSNGQTSTPESRKKEPLDFIHEIPSHDSTPYAIIVENGFFTPSGSAEPFLRNIDIRIRSSTCNMAVGPVGSGKSMHVVECADRRDSAHKGIYPLRDNIIAQTKYEEDWYNSVLWACGLQLDVSNLPRDDSLVGSGGNALSGGQKQRVALARSVYSRKPISLLDDVFSALDNTTARLVFNRLLGEGGMLRKSDDPEVESSPPTLTDPSAVEEDADLTRQSGDITLYKFYFKSVSAFVALFWLFLAIIYIGLGKAPQIWLRVWGEQGTNHNSAYYFGAYLALAMSCVIASALRVCAFHKHRAIADTQTSLGAVARLRRFLLEAPREDNPAECGTVPENWPSSGLIELKGVSAAYNGKSSFILTLLRLLEYQSGTIYIDGIDVSRIPRVTLRDRLTALPQDPVTINETVRLNLAPEASHLTDDLLITSLRKVKLWELIQERSGLDAEFGTMNLSHGQQQLFCLARVMLSRSKIVLLDEATSSLDRETDEYIQRVLRDELSDCTVITVAHRLETIVEGDVVIVMDGGEVAEVGGPRQLLEQNRSKFKDLWENRHK
ncbi:hypothetical protein CSUB01_10053 [Colletotrichum sublineola]|uniref:ABC transporter n=1 Tax=Colletotrichum sublineola TaxID=1173701 RepID=A0A066XN17_COLSU|nr:hypothetical protein CSUB01_10053 [Colletotrichum sublineola]